MVAVDVDEQSTPSGDHFPAFGELSEQSITFTLEEFKQMMDNIKNAVKTAFEMRWQINLEL